MDDLAEQERVLMVAIRTRGGIVQWMTNFTITQQRARMLPDRDAEEETKKVNICYYSLRPCWLSSYVVLNTYL